MDTSNLNEYFFFIYNIHVLRKIDILESFHQYFRNYPPLKKSEFFFAFVNGFGLCYSLMIISWHEKVFAFACDHLPHDLTRRGENEKYKWRAFTRTGWEGRCCAQNNVYEVINKTQIYNYISRWSDFNHVVIIHAAARARRRAARRGSAQRIHTKIYIIINYMPMLAITQSAEIKKRISRPIKQGRRRTHEFFSHTRSTKVVHLI